VLTVGDLFMVGDFSTETGTSAIVSGVSDLFCFVEIHDFDDLSISVILRYRWIVSTAKDYWYGPLPLNATIFEANALFAGFFWTF
jgi:hypothetical protein